MHGILFFRKVGARERQGRLNARTLEGCTKIQSTALHKKYNIHVTNEVRSGRPHRAEGMAKRMTKADIMRIIFAFASEFFYFRLYGECH